MKQLYSVSRLVITSLLIVFGTRATAQMIGDNAFLQGRYVEAGIAANGSMGSNRIVPSTYHMRSPSFNVYDPALAAYTGSSSNRLMMTYDAGHDGWTTGTPVPYFGDYSMPGTPYEAWSVEIAGTRGNADFETFLGSGSGYTGAGGGAMSGTVTGYTNSGGTLTATWQGAAGTGSALQITQQWILDTNASWVRINVKLKNVSSSALSNVYYMRHLDPDNDETTSGSFSTTNTINYQNDYYHRVMVTAAGTSYTTQTLSLSTKDCRAKCFIGTSWPSGTSYTLASYYAGGAGGAVYSGTNTGDYAIGMVWNLGTIAAGDSTQLTMAYVYNGLLGIDSALALPQLYVNGSATDSVDTITACAFSGDTLHATILNGSVADWAGSTWTWAPSSYLTATTGTSVGILASSLTSPVTYTITGTAAVGGCSGKVFKLTVMPPGTTPAPTPHDTSYCIGATPIPISATGIGAVWYWTTPTGGTGTTTAPTPSTAVAGTYTWYVSQVVAGCSSGRVPLTITVISPAASITGATNVCVGSVATVADATPGGSWVSSNTAMATIGSSTGIINGVSAGVITITYLLSSGCWVTAPFTVYATPAAITGTAVVCAGSTTTLANTLAGGTWTSSNTAVATVGAGTGVVTGVSGLGTSTITYTTPGGCFATRVVTVNPLPNPITGTMSVCVGLTTSLASTTPGGIWTSSSPANATVGISTGVVTGIAAGTAVISYRVAGCNALATVNVIATPPPPTGTFSTCIGSTTTLSHATPGGTWTSSNTAVATVGSSTGVVTGISLGTSTITYSLGAGCVGTVVVTVNAAPPSMTGSLSACVTLTTTLSHATGGGTWSTGSSSIATVSSGGVVTGVGAGTTTVTYTLPSGCYTVSVLTVNPLPAIIIGSYSLCVGSVTTFSSATGGITWSSSNTAVATVGASTGVVTGIAAGTVNIIETITATGCPRSATVTVNPLPATITGSLLVCPSTTTTLSDATAGGTWSGGTAGTATIDAAGVVTGVAAGTATVTYTVGTGCYRTAVVTVNTPPAAIGGALAVCMGATTTLTDATPGGTWSSSTTSVATVGVSTGVVTGVTAGTSTITYRVTATGCFSTAVVTVNTAPGAVAGAAVCIGQTVTLSSSTGGGTWTSGTTSVATIDISTGVVTGVTAGTSTITYSLGGTCVVTAVVTVTPLPSVIAGPMSVCAGLCATLTDASSGGTWSISPTSVATIVSGTGVYCGVSAGTATATYTTGCFITTTITVNALPAPITGTLTLCPGTTTALSNASAGGTWASGNTAIATIDAAGVVTGVASGTSVITYTLPTGCYKTAVVTVNALPAAIGGTPSVCVGLTTALSNTTPGGTWTSSDVTIATISSTGTVTGISAGTATITYTITSTGCIRTVTVTVNPLPAAITGAPTACPGTCTSLSDVTAGGVWSSGSLAIATIGATTGVACGVSAGVVNITYTLSATGCRATVVMTVNAPPAAIGGTASVCEGQTTALTNSSPGGSWSLTAGTGTATISSTGVVTGGTAGTVTVTYAFGSTGCAVTRVVTVVANPAAIGGTLVVCAGSTTSLSDATPGGAWISSNTSVATVGPTTGVVTGVSSGTSTITYAMSSGCYATAIVTVTTAPSAITGTMNVCEGLTTTLSSTPLGGTWSPSDATIATVDGSGVVTGVAAGTVTITYSLGTGCIKTAVVTVNISPAPIIGSTAICVGNTTSLSDATPGGSWSSSATGIATVSSSGVVTGVAAGTSNIIYAMPAGCSRQVTVTVNSLPATVADASVCQGLTTTMSSATTGGTWSSSATGTATIGLTSGIVTGVSGPGTATITYSLGSGCITTATVTVLPLPAAISGPLAVCSGLTGTLTDATAGGSWSSSDPSVATIGLGTGVVTAVSTSYATATITYTLASTGCYITDVATVNPLPATIMGSSGFCNLTSTTMSSASPGGTWTTSNPGVATIDPFSGLITGVDTGMVIITYTLPTGCITTKLDSIIFAPYPISGSPEVCVGSTVTLTNSITGGTWSSSNTSVATIGGLTGITTGLTAGNSTITYVVSTGCFSSMEMTVDATPAPITGTAEVCVGLTTTLTNSLPGGTWTSSTPSIATIDMATGVVTGIVDGTSTITYATPAGCNVTRDVTVNPLPAAITGTNQVCVGLCTPLSSATPGGTWSSSDPVIIGVSGTGMACGVTPGFATITYTLPTGCITKYDMTVNSLPSAITGTLVVCQGGISTLSNISAGGTWSSSDPIVAPIDAFGVVVGGSAGTSTITYTLVTGCIATAEFTVNPVPTGIGGSLTVCAGFMSNLTNSIPGGTWSMSGSPMVATIHPLTGVVTGITPGTITVTYTLGSGCAASAVVTVNPLPPAITGVAAVCENATTTLADAASGGTWTSSDAAIATVDPALGVVTGMTAGNAIVTYTISTGCINIRHVTVNPLPGTITGASTVCENFTTTLSSTPTGEAWTSSNTVVASVGLTSGVVTGLAMGTTNISYTIVATGCTRTKTMTVNPTPHPITGSSYICLGQVSSLSDTYPGGSWSSSNTAVATIGLSTGVASGVSLGSSVITYQLPVTGCYVIKPVTVSPLPNVYNLDTTTKHYCAGGTGVYINMFGSQIGASYAIYYGPSATGYATGTGAPINFGPLTVAGVYTVLATDATSGCKRVMNGNATVVIDPLVTPTVTVTTPPGNDTVCSGGPRTFTAATLPAGGTSTYIWKVNGMTVGTGSSYSFIPANGDVVSVTLNSTLACASPSTVTSSKTITVLPMVMPNIAILADPGDTICQYTLASYSVSPTYGGSAPTYTWMVNGSPVGTGLTYAYEPTHNDVVTVEMHSNYQCAITNTVTSSALVMAVDSMIVPHVTISATPGLMVNPGQMITLNTTVTHAGVNPTYQWKVNGVPVPGATNPSYTSTFNHYDSVTCMVTSDGWCRDITSFDWVFITIAPLGVQQVGLGGDLMLLPNPNKGDFTIRGTLGTNVDQELTAEVTNMLGQVVYRSKVMSKQGRVEAHIQLDNTLANGMYMLNLRSESASKVFHFVMEQ